MRQQQSSRFKRICVFCGSSQGKKTSYHDAAIDLAKELVIITYYYLASAATHVWSRSS